MAEDVLARFVSTELAKRGWNQTDLGREAGLNKNTLTDFFNGRSTPSRRTISRIEHALDLTPGTLEGLGEDRASAPRLAWQSAAKGPLAEVTWAPPSRSSEEELLAELSHRVRTLKAEIERLREPAEEMLTLRRRRQEFLDAHGDDETLRSIRDEIAHLVFKSQETSLSVDEEARWGELWDKVDLAMLTEARPPATVAYLDRAARKGDAPKE